jgi:hypothetical protein
MKFFKQSLVIGILFLFISLDAAYSSLGPEDEEIKSFRETIGSSYVFSGHITPEYASKRTEEIRELGKKFPGFQLINNHLGCSGCEDWYSRPIIAEGRTSFDRFRFLKDCAAKDGCWYSFRNCMEYAYVTAVFENCPNKDEGIAIINYLMREGIYSKIFDFIETQQVDNPEEAVFVSYSKNGASTHLGIYRGNGVVESKWGLMSAIFRHKVFQVPPSYGNEVLFHRVIFKKLPPDFVKNNWPNPLWELGKP